MLELVDAQRDGFAEADGAQMRRHLHAVLVRFVDRGAEIGARDLRVRLEPRHAFFGPVAHHATRVFGAGERMHRAGADARALEVRAGDDDASDPAISSESICRLRLSS